MAHLLLFDFVGDKNGSGLVGLKEVMKISFYWSTFIHCKNSDFLIV